MRSPTYFAVLIAVHRLCGASYISQRIDRAPHKRRMFETMENVLTGPRTMKIPRTIYIVCAILILGVILTVINIYELRAMQREHYEKSHGSFPSVEGELESGNKRRPIYWVRAKNADGGYLDHVFSVLERLGFVRGNREMNWDLLWHHDYPFLDENVRPLVLNMKPHQKLNHIPGSGFYTSKVNLATSNISGIPPAFSLPSEREKFMSFSRKHPEKYWVQKSNKHRGIEIKRVENLDLSQENSFIQEYISNPLLVDGRKFDIGVYTIVTSVTPLRVYVYQDEALFRFCAEDYQPFDPARLDKYVIGDDYTPMWEIKSLKRFYTDLNMGFKDAFDAYLRSIGKNPRKIWDRIDDTIRQTLVDKYPQFLGLLAKYKYPWNFFELSRFDFVVDEDFNVFLMEANMSPNLSSGHFAPNKLLYEQVIFNLFAVVGVARHTFSEFLIDKTEDEKQMRASAKALQVYPEFCTSLECAGSCDSIRCRTCRFCLTTETENLLRRAYLEHLNRMGTRRVVPVPFPSQNAAKDETGIIGYINSLPTEEDKLIAWWFRGKCLMDVSWCS